MATLEKIRSKAGLLVAVVGIALFAFVIGDFLNSGSSLFRQSQETIGTVDGERISIYDYDAKFQEMSNIYKMQYGESNFNEELTSQVRSATWEGMVSDILFSKEADKIGLTVTTEELFDMVYGDDVHPMIKQMPMFMDPNTQTFSKEILQNFLQTINTSDLSMYGPEGEAQIKMWKEYWLFYEKMFKKTRLTEKYNILVAKALKANNLEAMDALKGRSISANAEYAMQEYNTIADSLVTVKDAEIKKLYDERKERYKTSPSKTVQYLAVDIRPSENDYKEVEERINKLKPEFESTDDYSILVAENSDIPYVDAFVSLSNLDSEARFFASENEPGAVTGPSFNDNTYTLMRLIDKTVAPDSLKVRHIFVQRESMEATQVLADSLTTELKKGADFVALVNQFSLVQSKENGGEIGWMTEAETVNQVGKDFANTLFSTKVNEYIQIPTGNGIQILQITEATAPVQKAKIATVSMEVYPSSRTYSQLYNDINQILAQAGNSTEKLSSLATEKGYTIETANSVTAETESIADLKNSRRIVQWVFNNKKGAISDIYDCDDRFAVVYIGDENNDKYMPLKSVSGGLKAELLKDKKAEMLINKLSKENIQSIAQAATAMTSKADTAKFITFAARSITGIGNEPAVIGVAPSIEVNKVSAPLKGNFGVYVLKTYDKKDNTPQEINLDTEKQMINSSLERRIVYDILPTLKRKAVIEDNRIKFF